MGVLDGQPVSLIISLAAVSGGRVRCGFRFAPRSSPARDVGRACVLRAEWASGPWLGGSGHVGGTGGIHAEVAEPPADPGRGEPKRLRRPFPGPTEILGEGPGKAELGVGGGDQPRPQVGLLEQPKGMFMIESAEERLPAQVDVFAGHAGARGALPHRLRVAVTGQVLNLQPDQRVMDQREFTAVIEPGATGLQPGVHPVPGELRPCRSAWCRTSWPGQGYARTPAWRRRGHRRACGAVRCVG